MRSAVALFALGILVVGHVFAADESDEWVSMELWDALGIVLPERWTATLRHWTSGGSAIFETPLVRESERISAQILYVCYGKEKRWTCRRSHEELHIEANGMRHRIRAEKVQRDLIVRIAEYIYSPCFVAQRKQLGEAGRARWGDYQRPIYFMLGLGGNIFSVATGGGSSGVSFRIEAGLATENDCGFQLKSVGGHISMRPNRRIETDRVAATHAGH